MIYWCKKCNEPIFDADLHSCTCDGVIEKISEGSICNPVFLQERKLLSEIAGEDFTNEKMWFLGSSNYFYRGMAKRIPYREWYKAKRHLECSNKLREHIQIERDYSFYEGVVRANEAYIKQIVKEAEDYILEVTEKYRPDNYYPTISFSGGKDSTVVSRLVRDALSDNTTIHFFFQTLKHYYQYP